MKKRIACLLAAISVTVPVFAFNSHNISSFAEKIEFIKKDEDTNSLVANARYDIYEIGKDGKDDLKLLSVYTNSDGKFDKKTVKLYSVKTNPVDSEGNLDLSPGSYYAVETQAPETYMLNVKSEIFNVTSGKMETIYAYNKKFPSNMGQAVIKVVDSRNDAGLTGATLELLKKDGDSYKKLGLFSTDSEGYLIGGIENIDLYNGTILLSEGSYRVIEKSVVGNYKINDKNIDFDIKKRNTSFVTIKNSYFDKTSKTKDDKNQNQLIKDKKTGVKVKVVSSKDGKPLTNQGIAIYSTKNNVDKEVFNGVTNNEGYLDSKDATVGKDLALNSVIYLEPGDYYYKLTKYSNSAKHEFIVEEGKIGNQTLKLNIESTTTPSRVNYDSSTKLAKTGFEDNLIYTVSGMTFLLGGYILIRSKKID